MVVDSSDRKQQNIRIEFTMILQWYDSYNINIKVVSIVYIHNDSNIWTCNCDPDENCLAYIVNWYRF